VDPTLERLDRIIITKEWEGLFATVLVHKKPMDFSNHNPLILDSGAHPQRKSRDFRFEVSWLGNVEFIPKVRDIWMAPTRDSVALNRVMLKLKKVKRFLKGLGF
jgi:hypothetical protein